MNSLRNASLRASNSQSAAVYGRTIVSQTLLQQIQTSSIHLSALRSSRPGILLFAAPLRSKFLPDGIRIGSAYSPRSFHTGLSLGQEKATNPKPEPEKEKPIEEEGAKKSNSETGEEQPKEDRESEDAKKKDEKKEKEAPPPPPPPHGDKSPWQVFTETLQTEFKASKEWNESTKALSDGAHQFTESESVRKARQAYEATTGAVSSTTVNVLKTTAGAVGKGAAWTWETPVVKGVRTGVNATASVIEKGTRPIRETEAFKNVKNVIDDGSSSRYGGWVEKEERRKARELRELKEAGPGGKRQEVAQEDPEAGTNVTLHKDAAWKESWRDFRDSNKMMQGLFTLKSQYNESENPLISTARSISDRVAGFFAENETARVIKKFREMDPTFQMEPFIREMREYILPEVLDAYVKGDTETLHLWLSAAQFSVYDALSKQYTTAGLKSDGRILDIRHVDVLSARMLDPGDIPVFIVTCRTQEVHVYRNAKTNELAAGMEDKVQLVTYAIGVTRIPEDVNNPETRGWRLIELQKSGRDYI
ncbi:putative mitochondrial import inner membrane translocase subunit tim44 [Calycina marina]|uniref:Mitochondrial import inner membrane translocase subunit TIM44 n=1 Tax=Calycina marina TaxID=1763456 RepID=A0A9P8CIM8_9HELO|nr:putative mitochondrial import inner membrane translocase subunit tim44 [Calycina marina]